jgi:hypothetical protein
LLILLRKSIARSGLFVPSQTRRFAESRALASPAEVVAWRAKLQTSGDVLDHISLRGAWLFRISQALVEVLADRRGSRISPLGAAELTKCFPAFIA